MSFLSKDNIREPIFSNKEVILSQDNFHARFPHLLKRKKWSRTLSNDVPTISVLRWRNVNGSRAGVISLSLSARPCCCLLMSCFSALRNSWYENFIKKKKIERENCLCTYCVKRNGHSEINFLWLIANFVWNHENRFCRYILE